MASRHGIQVIPKKVKTDEVLEVGGDYILRRLILHNYYGEKTDILPIVQELNIYESIYNNAITGTLVVGDTKNQIARLKIQGLERISFKVQTPGQTGLKDTIDFTEESGDPLHVYKITNRRMVSQNLMVYTIHFASREFMRNLRTKVSQAFTGTLDEAVHKITKDYLDSKKTLFVETTSNQDTIVIPNKRPFDAINDIAKKSIPENTRGAVGYYFYETTKGFNFRSWESMVSSKSSFPRVPRHEFFYQPAKIPGSDPEAGADKAYKELRTIEEYEFVNNFHDVAANTVLGTYGHRVITYNFYDKTFNTDDYHYHDQFEESKHTDSTTSQFDGKRYAISNSTVDYDNELNISDFPESRVSLQGTTQFAHGEETGGYGIDVEQDGVKLGSYQSQLNQVQHGTTLKMRIKGQTKINAGDLIKIHLKDPNASRDSSAADRHRHDERFSGDWVITKLRHQITGELHTIQLECVKDAVGQSIQSSINPKRKTGSIYSRQEIDETDSFGGNHLI